MRDIKELRDLIKRNYEAAQAGNEAASYQALHTQLSRLEAELREHVQDITAERVRFILSKIKNGETLSTDDIATVKLWIVGDADYYTQLENNFGDWTAELARLMSAVGENLENPLKLEKANTVRALIQDCLRLLPNIVYFMEERERVQRFTETVSNLDRGSRLMLVELLEQQLRSRDS